MTLQLEFNQWQTQATCDLMAERESLYVREADLLEIGESRELTDAEENELMSMEDAIHEVGRDMDHVAAKTFDEWLEDRHDDAD